MGKSWAQSEEQVAMTWHGISVLCTLGGKQKARQGPGFVCSVRCTEQGCQRIGCSAVQPDADARS